MRPTSIALLLLASCAVASAAGNYSCNGTLPVYDDWCHDNCNHAGAQQCPPQFCVCEGDMEPEVTCQATGLFAGSANADEWCELVCNYDPPFCPAGFCACTNSSVAVPNMASYSHHEPTCCDNEVRYIFYSEAGYVYKRAVGSEDYEVCYEFPGGEIRSLVIDQADNLWIGDYVLGTVFKASTSCDPSSVEVVTSYALHGKIDNPLGLAFWEGNLYVADTVRLWSCSFTEAGELYSIDLVQDQAVIRDMEVIDGVLYYITADAAVYTSVGGVFIAVHDYNVPDIGGIAKSDCGFAYTVTDSNQIHFCPDDNQKQAMPSNTNCTIYCEIDDIDDGSCVNTWNPAGIHAGCCCDLYIQNPGNGCLTVINNDGILDGPGPFAPTNLHCNLTRNMAVTFWVPPGSPTGCQSVCDPDTPTPTVVPTPTVEPTPTPATTGRLVPGVNLQFAGGITQGAVATGTAVVTLIKCPEGADITGLTGSDLNNACPPLLENLYRIPVSHLLTVNQAGDAERIEDITPLLTAASEDPNQRLCMMHTEPLINNGGVIEICDQTCMDSNMGHANPADCTASGATEITSASTRARTRAGASTMLGTTVTNAQLAENDFQSASASICDGDVVAEFSVNLMNNSPGTSINVNVLVQPRFDLADRCDASETQAPRLCYDTSADATSAALHGVFGDANNLVCVSEFLVEGGENLNVVDVELGVRLGDIVDDDFGVSGRTTGCTTGMNTAPFNAFCGSFASSPQPDVSNRLCLATPC